MKIEKSNNPLAAGALVVVLVLIVGRIGWMLLGQNETAAAASSPIAARPAAGPQATAVLPAVPPVVAASAAPPRSDRNPFSRAVQATPVALLPSRAPEQPEILPVTVAPIAPLAPMPIHAPGIPKRSAAPHPAVTETPEKSGEMPMLKLTAIVGGAQPTAILQTAQPEPVMLHIGDRFANMRVVAINNQDNDQDIVFARGESLWTLPLQSAGDKAAPDPVSVVSAASEENPNELR